MGVVAQVKLLLETTGMGSNKTVDRNSLQVAFQTKYTLGALIVQASLIPDSVVFG